VTKTLRIPTSDLRAGKVTLAGEIAHYVGRVQRCRPGDTLLLFDPASASEALAELVAIDAHTVTCVVGPPRPASRLGLPGVHLVQALGKGDKPEDTLRAVVALGVGQVTFVESSRSVARVSDRAANKRERLIKVAVEAARQSLRGDLPHVVGPLAWRELQQVRAAETAMDATISPQPLRLILDPMPDCRPLLAVLAERRAQQVELWVGPEGGFSDAEGADLSAAGGISVSLGPLVLRTELAALAAVAVTMAWALADGRWTPPAAELSSS
jgi:16S rRNA (uracil1498-N3)-methyltransferase